MKATGAANTFGVSMESLIGHATAIGEVTRESGNIIGNSLKTIYSRITTMDDSETILNSVGISIRDMQNNLLPVEQILGTLASRWNTYSKETQQALGVQLAGRYQLSRFLVLMQQYDQALTAQQTAINSNGSSYRENQAYLDSYQAKLNQLSNAWTTLSVSMGENVLGNGIILVSNTLIGIANATEKVIKTIGLLPSVFGIAGVAFLAFNNSTRTAIMQQGVLASSLVRAGDSMKIAAGASRLYQTQLYNMTLAARGASAAVGVMATSIKGVFSFLSSAILPVAGFMLLGGAISYLTDKFIDAQESQKKAKQEAEKLTESYAENETQIQNLVSKYEQLSNQVKSGLLPETDKEYLKVQQDLYELLPSVAESVDKNGQAHLRSADSIRKELGYLNDLVKIDAEKFINSFSKKVADLNSEISSLQDKINNPNKDNVHSQYIPRLSKEQALEDMGNRVMNQRDIDAQLEKRKQLFQDLANEYAKYYGVKQQVTKSDQDYIKTIVYENQSRIDSKKGIEEVQNKIKSYIGTIGEVRAVTGSAFTTNEIINFVDSNDKVVKVFHEMFNAIKDGNTDWDKYKNDLEHAGIKGEKLNTIIENLKNGHFGLQNEVKNTAVYIDEEGQAFQSFSEAIKNAQGNFKEISNIIGNVAKSGEINESITYAQKDAYESLSNELSPLNKLLEDIANGKKISAAEAMELIAKEQELTKAISIENGQIKINKQAVEALRDAKITSYNNMLKSIEAEAIQTANATINKLKNYGIEIEAIKSVADAKQRLADMEAKRNQADGDWITRREYNTARAELVDVTDLLSTVEQLSKMATTGLKQVGTSTANNSKSTNKNTKSTKDAKKALEEYTYVSDDFKKKLNNIEIAIAKQQSIQSKYPKWSKQYQDAIKKEIKLLQDKKKAIENEQKSLKKQIDTGKIKQTGVVKKGEEVITTSPSSKYKVSNMINEARKQAKLGTFEYKQIGGEFTGTYKEFLKRAKSDCSQFVQEYYQHFLGKTVPRTAAQQWKAGKAVKKGEQKAGDLVFWNTTGKKHSHVGIYTGNGKVIQMGTKGLREIKINDIKNFEGFRRIPGVNSTYSKSSTSKAKGNSNEAKIWNFLASKGLNKNAIAGIMGNLKQESHFNPNLTAKDGAFGIAQWTKGRKASLQKYAKSKGKSASDLQTQLEFMWKELNGAEKKALNYIKKNPKSSASNIAAMFDKVYERSAGTERGKRQKYANEILNKYASKSKGGKSTSSNSSKVVTPPTLKIGSKGEWVKKLQKQLGVTVDGIFGQQTLKALRAFQKKNKLNVTGIVDSKTWSKLGVKTSGRDSKKVAEGKEAKDKAQEELNNLEKDRLAIYQDIQELYKKLIDGILAGTDRQRELIDIDLGDSERTMEGLVDTSKEYSKELDKQISLLEKKKKLNEQDIKTLEEQNEALYYNEKDRKKFNDKIKKDEKENASLQKKNASLQKKRAKLEKERNAKGTSKKRKAEIDKEIKTIDKEIKKNNEKIKKNNEEIDKNKKSRDRKRLDPATRKDNELIIKQKEDENKAITAQQKEIGYEKINKKIKSYDDKQSRKDLEIRKKELELSTLENKNSDEYKQNLADQINLHLDKKRLLDDQIKYIQDQIKNNKTLTDAQKEELNGMLAEYENAKIEIDVTIKEKKEEIKQIYDDIADKYIEAMKDAYEKARDIELDALNETRKAREKAHKVIMDNYDEEEKKLDELYNKKMREIDDQQSNDNYDKELKKKQKEAEDIQKKINKLAIDDSIWAKKQREELEKQLADKQEEITQFVNDRNVELRKKSLSDQLESDKKAIDEKRDIENKAYEKQQEEWDELEKFINRKYDNLINDERYWSQVRQDILKGDVAKYKDSITDITSIIDQNNKIIGESIANNIIDVLAEAQKGLDSIKSSYDNLVAKAEAEDEKARKDAEAKLIADAKKNEEAAKAKGISRYEVTWTDKKTGEFDRYLEFKTKEELDAALKKYNNSKLNTEIKTIYKKVKSYDVTLTNPKTGDKVEKSLSTQSEVDALVKKYPDYIPQVLPKYHQGGIIGDIRNNRLTELANKLFNTKPNEQTVKALKGELMIPPQNIINGLNNVRNLITSTPPLLTPVATAGNTEINMNITIEKLMGGEKGANELFKVLNKKLAGRGVK